MIALQVNRLMSFAQKNFLRFPMKGQIATISASSIMSTTRVSSLFCLYRESRFDRSGRVLEVDNVSAVDVSLICISILT